MNKQSNNKPVVCIFCSSGQDVSERIKENGAALATLLAKSGFSLLYGGTTCGLMKIVADAHKAAGGELIGIIPQYMIEKGIQHPHLDKVFQTNDLSDRKQVMLENSDYLVALPGGIGTYDEFFDTLTSKQLKRHDKPMFLFNIDGYFEPLMSLLHHSINEKTVKPEHLELFKVGKTPEEMLQLIKDS